MQANRNLTGLEAKICDLENALLKTEESLRLTRTELEAANKRVVEKDELVSARDKRILSLEAELTDQLKSIAEKDLTIADRDQQLIALQAELKRRLAEKDSIIDERDSQLSAKNAQYSESHQTLLIKITELSIRDEEITRLQKLLADKSDLIKSLSDKESSLMLISADLERALQANLSLQADLDASNRNLTALEAKICDLENALLKTEEALRLTRTELEAANKKVSEKDELVSARDSRILSLEAELTDQLKSIADKDLTIADRDQQLIALQAELKRRLGEKDSIIDERDSQLSAKNVQYSESHQTLLIKITELSIRDEEITRLQKLLADKSDLIKSLSDKESSLMLISADLERALQANLSLQADLDASNRNLTGTGGQDL
jgi:chromosome segregation ATPase